MKKLVVLTVAFLLCGLMTNAQISKNLKTYDTYTWDVSSNCWTSYAKMSDLVWDSNGYMTSWVNYSWSAGNWVKGKKGTATYVGDKDTEHIFYVWDATSNSWTNDSKLTYTYNTSGKNTEHISCNWNAISSSWVNKYKLTYTYNTSGKKITETQYIADANSNWNTSNQYVYTYDATGNQATNSYYYWSGSVWHYGSSSIETYNSDGNILTSTDNSDKSGSRNQWTYTYDTNGNQIESIRKEWNSSSNTWVNAYKTVFSYSNSTTDIPVSIEKQSYSLYPNPARNELHISTINEDTRLLIYDISGKLILQSIQSTIDISSLKDGIYTLKIVDKKGVSTKKFLKQ